MQDIVIGVSNIENIKSCFSFVGVTCTDPTLCEGWSRDGSHGTGKCQGGLWGGSF